MTDTLALLQAQNIRDVWLFLDGESAIVVPSESPGAAHFRLARVPARHIRSNLLYAALGRDAAVEYSIWYQAQGAKERDKAEAAARKFDDPVSFDDSPPDDSKWRAHAMALEEAMEEAVLERALLYPPYAEVREALGPYRTALVREVVQWDREIPDEGKPFAEKKSLSGSSEPP